MRPATLILLLAGMLGAAPEPSAAEPLPSRLEEEVLVRRIRWPVRFEEKKEGACEGLLPSMVRVTEDGGAPLPVEEIDRRRMPTVHAILVDASGSRLPQVGATREAALAYIEGIRGEDPVMAALFGESLHLLLPLTRDRELAAATIGRPAALRAQGFTALWDSLYDLVRYLEDRPERKVIILLSDGCENRSMMSQLTGGYSSPLEAAVERSENLSLFTIGIDLPSRCRGETRDTDPRDLFRTLAESTGGAFHSLRYRQKEGMFPVHLARAFDQIRARLQREGSILYRPRPFGEGPRDDPAGESRRRRRVRVRLGPAADGTPPPAGCELRSAGPRTRVEGAADPDEPLLSLLPLTSERTLDPALDRRTLAAEALPLPPAELWRAGCAEAWSREAAGGKGSARCPPGPPDSWIRLGEERIEGRLVDVEAERGFLFEPSGQEAEEGERYRQSADRAARLGNSELSLPLPPFEVLRDEIVAPELALFWLLNRGEAPSFLHGSTFLQTRRYLGQALFAYPGYREHAQIRAAEIHREENDSLLELVTAERGGLEPPEREELRRLLDERARLVRPLEPQLFLAEWIEDVSAERLSARVEGRVANLFLARSEAAPREEILLQARRWAERTEAGWETLGSWFPRADRARVVVPMVPVFDRERGVSGFFRVILPYPEIDMRPWFRATGGFPSAPLGLRTVRWVLDRPLLEEQLPGELLLGGLGGLAFGSYERRRQVLDACEAARRDPRFEKPCEALPEARSAVRLRFDLADAPEAAFALVAYFAGPESARGDRVPVCAVLERIEGAGERARALANLVAGELSGDGLLCSPTGS